MNKKKTYNCLAYYKLNSKQNWLAVLFFLLVLAIHRWESIYRIQDHYLGTPNADAGLYLWLFKTNLRDLFELPWFNTRGFYPYTQSLAWSDNFILPSILAWPFVKLGLAIPVAYNLILLAANFLNGYITFRLAYQISNHYFGALIAGASFFTFPFLTLHLGHPQLQFAFWIPLSLILFFRFLHWPKLLNAFLIGFCLFCSFLTTVYYTIFCLMLLELFFLSFLILNFKFFFSINSIKLFLGFLLGFIPTYFFAYPYFAIKETFGARELKEAFSFSADFLSYFSAPSSSLLHNYSHYWSHGEALLFPGTIVIAASLIIIYKLNSKNLIKTALPLALIILSGLTLTLYNNLYAAILLWIAFAVFIVLHFKNRSLEKKLDINYISNRGLIISIVFAAFVFCFISLGPLGNENNLTASPGLYSIYYYLFPGAEALRAIGRAGLVVALLLSLLIPFALRYIGLKKSYPLFLVLLLVAVFENYPRYYPLEPALPATAVYKNINQYANQNDVIISLPLTKELKENNTVKSWKNFATYNIRYLNWQYPTELHSLNGYSGQRSYNMLKLPGRLKNFPDQASIEALSQISNLKFITFLPRHVNDFDQKEFLEKVSLHQTSLSLLEQDQHQNYIFMFHPTIELDPSLYFQVPSYPQNKLLKFDIKIESEQQELVELNLHLKKYYEQSPFSILQVISNNNWTPVEIALPKTVDKVRPYFVNFKFADNLKVFIRDIEHTVP